ncbi:oxidoreductase-like domain-containing protein [Aquisalimonas sp.]|uniref:oxidoreductase-like domain-containing protein n=1 Tax=unclassified Aquisalimonas TaxID=2644645 RepID=UPI0025BB90AE|nr:oxidoreductase-like domain-containing protein [Aquisalimonas sp.]
MSDADRRPEPPHPMACCQGNCVPCVFDLHEQELERWEHRRAERARQQLTSNGRSPLDVLRERMR